MSHHKLFEKLSVHIKTLDYSSIPEVRLPVLHQLRDYIQDKQQKGQVTNLNFICTHNSRRSHFSQIWAQTAAWYYGIPEVFCYSGGTAVTSLFPGVAATLETQGFSVLKLCENKNPIYQIKFADIRPSVIGFSKTFDHPFNPSGAFAAIMTCSQADEDCPFIPGAELRIPLNYEDPKAFDQTPEAAGKYLERSIQIATELFYVFSLITH